MNPPSSVDYFSAAGCSRPLRFRSRPAHAVDTTTGEVFSSAPPASSDVVLVPQTGSPERLHYARCNNRRSSACEDCSKVYARDAYEVVRSGIPDDSPLTFITLTAPSMGGCQHHISSGKHGKQRCTPKAKCSRCGERTACGRFHAKDDPFVGAPVCGCFDYARAAAWNYHAPKLWEDFITRWRRARKALKLSPDIAFFRVQEPHRRGLVHLHVLARGLHDENLIRRCAKEARFSADGETFRYGENLDIKRIYAHDVSARRQVMNYLPKYLTKSLAFESSSAGASSRHRNRLRAEAIKQAVRRGARCSWSLRNPGLRCACDLCSHASRHTRRAGEFFGMAGHVFSKSNSSGARWGKTLRECRQARRDFHGKIGAALPLKLWTFVSSPYGMLPEDSIRERLATVIRASAPPESVATVVAS